MQEVDDLFSVHLKHYVDAEDIQNDADSFVHNSNAYKELNNENESDSTREDSGELSAKQHSGGAREVFQRAADGDVLADQVLDEVIFTCQSYLID